MATAVSPRVTPDDLLRMPDGGKGFELVDGELRELNLSARSCRIGGLVYLSLANHAEPRALGWAYPPETGYRCFSADPSRVRKPDASFLTFDRMSAEEYEAEGFIEIVPDIVAEVISPNDNAEELWEKIEQWLATGVKLVWEVNPSTRVVRAHRPDGPIAVLRTGDALTAPDIVPGFSCPVIALFLRPGESVPPA